jgi:hypothetical protein
MYEKIKRLNVSCPIASRQALFVRTTPAILRQKIINSDSCNEPFLTLHYFGRSIAVDLTVSVTDSGGAKVLTVK